MLAWWTGRLEWSNWFAGLDWYTETGCHIDQISLISLRNLIGLAGHIGLINLNGRVGQSSLASQVGLGFSGAIGKYDG